MKRICSSKIVYSILIICILYLSVPVVESFDIGVRGTACNLDPPNLHDPCQSLYGAECDGAHCKCPVGTHEDPALRRCVAGAKKPKAGEGDDFFDLPLDYDPGAKPQPKAPKPEKPAPPAQAPPRQPPVPLQVPAHPQAPVEDASCTSEQFFCDNGTCIPNAWVCDSYSDCQSGEDEAQCPSTVKTNDFPHCDMTRCSACFSKSRCPTDFVKFKDTCLWIYVFPNPWEIAQKICQSQESKFASIPLNEQLMEFLTFLKQKDLIGRNYWVAGAGNSVDFPERKMETHHEFYGHLMKKEGFVKSVNHIDKCNYLHNSLPEIFRSPECADYAGVICEWINPRKLQ